MTADHQLIATGLPGGWIEVVAFETRRHLAAFLDAQMDADAGVFDPTTRDRLHEVCGRAYDLLADQGWLHAGCVVTQFPDDGTGIGGTPVKDPPYDESTPWRTTAWTYAVGLLPHPPTGEINPIALLERSLGRLGPTDVFETFTLEDGRDVLAVATTTAATPDPWAAEAETLPQWDPDALGTVIYVVAPIGMPDHLVACIGIAPNVDERSAMSVVALEMATSVHRPEDPRQLRSDAVLVDTTGTFQPTGSMPSTSSPAWAGLTDPSYAAPRADQH